MNSSSSTSSKQSLPEYAQAVPSRTMNALRMYIDHGIDPGQFLGCVLANDLFGALLQADDDNAHTLRQLAMYIYNNTPGDCWGSSDAVRSWTRNHANMRLLHQ